MANRARPELFSPIGTLSARKPPLGAFDWEGPQQTS